MLRLTNNQDNTSAHALYPRPVTVLEARARKLQLCCGNAKRTPRPAAGRVGPWLGLWRASPAQPPRKHHVYPGRRAARPHRGGTIKCICTARPHSSLEGAGPHGHGPCANPADMTSLGKWPWTKSDSLMNWILDRSVTRWAGICVGLRVPAGAEPGRIRPI